MRDQCKLLANLIVIAGYLYALLWALQYVKPDDEELSDLAMKTALQIVKEGRERKCVFLSRPSASQPPPALGSSPCFRSCTSGTTQSISAVGMA